MSRIDPTVKKETGYIAGWVLLLSAVMELVFLLTGHMDYTVPLGNLLGGGAAILNFFLMGWTIQRAVGLDEKAARMLAEYVPLADEVYQSVASRLRV